MMPAPRFTPHPASHRKFVNRHAEFATFHTQLQRMGEPPHVLNFVGVGGMGKSRLLRELQALAGPVPHACLDFRIPTLRQQPDALSALRAQLNLPGGTFDRFDIAYAVLWQRFHPHLRLAAANISFLQQSAVLTDVIDAVTGFPAFATARGLVTAFHRGKADLRRRRLLASDPTLTLLDDLSLPELADAVTYLFAQDLRRGSARTGFVIFIDSHESLVTAPTSLGGGMEDAWLQDVAGQLGTGLFVIASREPLPWPKADADWHRDLAHHRLPPLTETDRLELLRAGGIADPNAAQVIAAASTGMPFYLNLALDGQLTQSSISDQKILDRFLQHVPREIVQILELLCPTRIFDFAIFQDLCRAHQVSSLPTIWNSLTSYSFVSPTGAGFTIHHLMANALHSRIPAASVTAIHDVLNASWHQRATAADTRESDRAAAWTEAIYHGSRGTRTSVEFLGQVDAAVRVSGPSVVAVTLAGLGQSEVTTRLAPAILCLRAEDSLHQGNCRAAIALGARIALNPLPAADPLAARLVLSAAHGYRLLGQTAQARRLYGKIWRTAEGSVKLRAGLWSADLQMAGGKFREAEQLSQTLAQSEHSDREFQGEVARLRALIQHFSLLPDQAVVFLELARSQFSESVLGKSLVATNQLEFSAWNKPEDVILAAAEVIEIHREFGAYQEIGKAYTAVAIAQLRLGNERSAQESLDQAVSALRRAGYASGLARAELVQAVIQARRADLDEATMTLRRAAKALQTAQVYPTLVWLAAIIADEIGYTDDTLTTQARAAQRRISPCGDHRIFQQTLRERAQQLLGRIPWQPQAVFSQAAGVPRHSADQLSGHYHENTVVHLPNPVIVRRPTPAAPQMDLVLWPEADIMRTIRAHGVPAPRLLYASQNPDFQVMEFIPGALLNETHPRGTPTPPSVASDISQLFSQLAHIQLADCPPIPQDWPSEADTTEFACRLSALTQNIHNDSLTAYGDLFAQLGIPVTWPESMAANWSQLSRRSFGFLHCDLHRKNIIRSDHRTVFLDWELSLWGDRVYEIAVHLHKMEYLPTEERPVVAAWLDACPSSARFGWEADLPRYLAHERVKSAIVDTMRTAAVVTKRTDPGLAVLAAKIRRAQAALGYWGHTHEITTKFVADALADWASTGP